MPAEFRGRRRTLLLQPGRYTELFFLDEATAFAAGHRPCAECRRADYRRFGELWRAVHPADHGADAIDRTLHAERWVEGRPRRHPALYSDLPDATIVVFDDAPWVVSGGQLMRWTAGGYRERRPRPTRGRASVLTPPSLRALLATGWGGDVPLLHPSSTS